MIFITPGMFTPPIIPNVQALAGRVYTTQLNLYGGTLLVPLLHLLKRLKRPY
ncbi:hypothetical protein DSBG_3441 [Desulfosporosinus sp. BG]|nr:hypothetical protein DSBG_3441 [Desulfosporosinus sp. BG]